MGLTDALVSVIGGGATGIVGTLISQVVAFKNKKADAADRVMERAHELRTMEFEAAANAKLETIRSDAAVAVAGAARDSAEATAAGALMTASHASDGRRYASSGKSFLFVIVDFVRGMMRPVLTLGYTVLAAYVLFVLFGMIEDLKGAIDQGKIVALFEQTVLLVLYLASATCLWWFGTRASDPHKK